MAKRTNRIIIILLIFLLNFTTEASTFIPEIKELRNSDPLFTQLEQDISDYYRFSKSGKPIPGLMLYRYHTIKGDSLFTLSSRINIPYDTLAILNGLSNPIDFPLNTEIFIPNIPGLFISLIPETELEYLMISWRDTNTLNSVKITLNIKDKIKEFIFLPGESFHPVERAFFLGILFRFPLPSGRITSGFGSRINPFSGHITFHNGIDIAAHTGTEVFPARKGIVKNMGYDNLFGNYIIIEHEGDYETFYGHLNKCFVTLHQKVATTMIIGEVGNSGLSTGSHLHFEIRRQGKPRNPVPLLPKVN